MDDKITQTPKPGEEIMQDNSEKASRHEEAQRTAAAPATQRATAEAKKPAKTNTTDNTEKTAADTKSAHEKLAIVRIRGGIRVKKTIKDTMEMLKLYRQNYCVIYEKTPSISGMLRKIKDYVTWGEIDDETIKLLEEKRGSGKQKGFFRLSPPRGGFERKGIKKPFGAGGALGYRGAKINELVRKMV